MISNRCRWTSFGPFTNKYLPYWLAKWQLKRHGSINDCSSLAKQALRTGLMLGDCIRQVFPKHRKPDQPAETWTGRGKQPRWLTAKLSSGKKLEHSRIQPSKNRVRRYAR